MSKGASLPKHLTTGALRIVPTGGERYGIFSAVRGKLMMKGLPLAQVYTWLTKRKMPTTLKRLAEAKRTRKHKEATKRLIKKHRGKK